MKGVKNSLNPVNVFYEWLLVQKRLVRFQIAHRTLWNAYNMVGVKILPGFLMTLHTHALKLWFTIWLKSTFFRIFYKVANSEFGTLAMCVRILNLTLRSYKNVPTSCSNDLRPALWQNLNTLQTIRVRKLTKFVAIFTFIYWQ